MATRALEGGDTARRLTDLSAVEVSSPARLREGALQRECEFGRENRGRERAREGKRRG